MRYRSFLCTNSYYCCVVGVGVIYERKPLFEPVPVVFSSRRAAGALFADTPRRASLTDDTPVDPADEPFVEGIKRGQICAFMTGFSFFIMETKVAVDSILHFMPGMRVAIATQAEEVSVFER